MISPQHQRIAPFQYGRRAFDRLRTSTARKTLSVLFAFAVMLSAINVLASEFDAEESEVRLFTNKEGQKIEAILISVGGSMRTVSIERPSDARLFDLEITTLSLDDQQYIKDWLRSQPAPQLAQLNLRLQGQPFLTEATREKFEDRIYGGSGTRSKLGYQFKINNLSREPLLGCRLEYVVLIQDRVEIRISESDGETVRWRMNEDGPVIYRSGHIALDALKYNTEFSVISATVPHEEIRAGSAGNSAEDKVLGVLARLTTADGTPLVEFSDIDSRHSQLNWESFAQLRDSAETDGGEGTLTEALVSR